MSEFGGKTISGDISHYGYQPKAQDDPQVFLDALDALLDVPGVEAVRWNQYTPYFNDGEACVFGIGSAYVKIAGDPDDEAGDYGDGYRDTYSFHYYERPDRNDWRTWIEHPIEIEGVDVKAIQDALKRFEDVLDNGRHYVVLADKFGDPAQVTATKAGFEVEYYEHD